MYSCNSSEKEESMFFEFQSRDYISKHIYMYIMRIYEHVQEISCIIFK